MNIAYKKIKKYLEENNISCSKLAKNINMSRQNFSHHYANLKMNKLTFSPDKIKLLSEITGVKYENFFDN
ncbi:Helix-turn-helix domain [Sebaldella termitidis]|uniref:HTH cro/C1-type domain-containing protein n=1 Tax=Sebaldella termitidis (strain ATCC 33386 / NCTC 11300) TaxID=526218 RepID=D1ANA2_SEBTE|nr:helix-turn-helix transcriptional regulator [Sebaldella termitidis]ACZ09706.1 hypothetical protein Sterm_2862 [Sebaldella termitidis ATCC 33386]SUI25037.1 Helix-turn-helix domain [Sebaldella termitidis]